MANPIADTFKNSDAARRLLALIAILFALLPVWLLVKWAMEPSYLSLQKGLELDQAAAIAESLDNEGINYKLGVGGTEVLVASRDVDRARVILAKDGVQVGRPGLELFDKPAWGMTDFTQRVTYRRALEGELARTIGKLRGVRRAYVHIALPEARALRKLQRPAEAAVVVSLNGGSLPEPVVQGIGYLVSSAVDGLEPDRVAVLDDAGRLLSIPGGEGSALGLSSRQLEMKRSVESYMANKIQNLLASVVGIGQSRVQVAANLNFEQVDKTVETYDPEGQVIVSEQRSEGNAAGGGQGAVSTVNSYQNSRSVERVIGPVGDIRRLTVAVLVNASALEQQAGSNAVQVNQQLAGIRELVGNAVGIDSTRGDRLTVTPIPFDTSQVGQAPVLEAGGGGIDMIGLAQDLSRPLVALIGIIVSLILALKAFKTISRPPRRALAARSQSRPQNLPAEEEPPAMAQLEPSKVEQIGKEITVATGEELPAMAAKVVKAWLAEDA